MTVISKGRRQFLVGAGGFTLALPLLPSLLTPKARAQAARPGARFVAMATPHGGAWPANLHPPDDTVVEEIEYRPGHKIRRGRLATRVESGKASLSAILSAPSNVLTDRLAGKLNVLRGFDVQFHCGHGTGQHLGNFARVDRQYAEPSLVDKMGGMVPTVDQVLAWSRTFYGDLDGVAARSIHVGHDGAAGGGASISWGYANPKAGSGAIQPVRSSPSALHLFKSMFGGAQEAPKASARVPLVDRVLESYRRTRSGAFGDAARISSADKQRLDGHMALLSELERRTHVVSSCGSVTPSTTDATIAMLEKSNDLAQTKLYYQTFNDVVAAALRCGICRIATINNTQQTFSDHTGNWHEEIAHQANLPDGVKQQVLLASYQRFFEWVFLDLVAKLDVEEIDGKTVLDSTLVQWTQESGPDTHTMVDFPVITAGSAGGALRTGLYCDYRNRDRTPFPPPSTPVAAALRPGILYNQWLATVLQAMGLPPSEFERNGDKGYGSMWNDTYDREKAWPDYLRADASNIVPFLKS